MATAYRTSNTFTASQGSSTSVGLVNYSGVSRLGFCGNRSHSRVNYPFNYDLVSSDKRGLNRHAGPWRLPLSVWPINNLTLRELGARSRLSNRRHLRESPPHGWSSARPIPPPSGLKVYTTVIITHIQPPRHTARSGRRGLLIRPDPHS